MTQPAFEKTVCINPPAHVIFMEVNGDEGD